MKIKKLLKPTAFWIIYCLAILIVIFLVFKKIDSPVVTGIAGIIIGSLSGAFGVLMNTWVKNYELIEKTRDREERIRDRSSKYALELTKMDFELRQKSLEITGNKNMFLAPIKVYRELYKALLELHKKGTWPKTIEKLGLLNIFPLGSRKK
jgi:hypothetical protein